MRYFLLLCLLTVMLNPCWLSAQTPADSTMPARVPVKTALAVLDLDATNIGIAEAKSLSDRLRIEIFNTGSYEMLEREKMTKILEEMEFQLSGCTSDECAVEVGRLVGVTNILVGSIGKVGEYYTVSARIIDVETGKIIKTATEDIEGTLGSVLTLAIPSIAKQIAGQARPLVRTTQKKTVLKITSFPPEADVHLNGVYRGQTPMEIEVAPVVQHRVKITKSGYETWERIYELTDGQSLDVSVSIAMLPKRSETADRTPKRPKRDYKSGFKVRYTTTQAHDDINEQIAGINQNIYSSQNLFKEIINAANVQFAPINNFNGVEFYNLKQIADVMSFDFGVGVYRADLQSWLRDVTKGKNDHDADEYSLVTWSPQLSAQLRFYPIRYILFYPYLTLGLGYNVLALQAFHGDEAIGGPSYHSWGLIYGVGFEVRPIKPIGVAIEMNRRVMEMELMEIGRLKRNYESQQLDKIRLTGNNLGLSLNLYY